MKLDDGSKLDRFASWAGGTLIRPGSMWAVEQNPGDIVFPHGRAE